MATGRMAQRPCLLAKERMGGAPWALLKAFGTYAEHEEFSSFTCECELLIRESKSVSRLVSH
jgi:hypothetical protein